MIQPKKHYPIDDGHRDDILLISLPMLSERFLQALQHACTLHWEQRRKGDGAPYISHLLLVTGTVLDHGGTEDQAIAALFHDAIEDQPDKIDPAELKKRYGSTALSYVLTCSDSTSLPKAPWMDRKRRFIETLASADNGVKLIVAADKLHNVRSILRGLNLIGEDVFLRFSASKEQTVWYYRQVLETLQRSWSHPILTELSLLVEALEKRVHQSVS